MAVITEIFTVLPSKTTVIILPAGNLIEIDWRIQNARGGMADYIGAIDQGTTSTRFLIFDRAGRIVACAQKEHEQIMPEAGWVEHNPEEIWLRTREVIADAMAQAQL